MGITKGIQRVAQHDIIISSSVLPTGAATAAKQLPDNHQVTVSNPTANPETGLAKDSTLTDSSQITKVKETAPTDTSKTNPSYVLTRNVGGYITSIAQTIGATTYTKTITRDVNNYITNISVWV